MQLTLRPRTCLRAAPATATRPGRSARRAAACEMTSGSAEFDGGVGTATFRAPAAPAPPKQSSRGRPGVAAFEGGTGTAMFASRPPTALDRLKRYGLAGVLAYGLFNTVYYAAAFLAAWAARGAAVRGAGIQAGAKEAAAVLAAVWVGSQVTKALRAGLALALAPLVDSAIHRVALKTGARRKAIFAAAVLVCAVCGLGVMAGAVIVNA